MLFIMRCHFILAFVFLLILVQPVSAQEYNPYGQENPAQVWDDIESAKWVEGGLLGGYWELEFKKKNFEIGNRGYRDIISNQQQQNTRRSNSQVYEYRSGGIQVDNDPPAWAKSRTHTMSQQAKAHQRKLRNAQIEQRNREVREHNQRVMRERAAREAEKEAARKAEQERQRQIRYNMEYARAMANSAQRFARQVDNAYQQRENMAYLRDKKIDHLPKFSSGHETTNERIATKPRTKTSIAGIVSKNRRNVAMSGLETHAVPITIKKEEHVPQFVIVGNRPSGDPLGNAIYYGKKGVNASTLAEKRVYQIKSAQALSEAIGRNGMPNNLTPQIQARVEKAVSNGMANAQRTRYIPLNSIPNEMKREVSPVPQIIGEKKGKPVLKDVTKQKEIEGLEEELRKKKQILQELQREHNQRIQTTKS